MLIALHRTLMQIRLQPRTKKPRCKSFEGALSRMRPRAASQAAQKCFCCVDNLRPSRCLLCVPHRSGTRQKLVTFAKGTVRHTVATVSVLVSLRRQEEPSARAGLPLPEAPETRFSFLGVSTRRRARASRGRSLGRRSLRIHRCLGWHLLGLPLASAGRYTGATVELPLSCGCGST